MSRAERRAMVTRPHPGLRQCRLLSGRSSLYYTPKGESAEPCANQPMSCS